jgi:methionine-rich copper-binding protein CopC
MRRSRLVLASLAMAGLLGVASPALAHARLDHAIPAVGGKVAVAPARLALFFTEGVVPHFCRVVVLDAQQKPVRTGAPEPTEGNGSELLVPLPPLAAGTYTVDWHATSVDTHETKGQFTFTVEH